MNLTNEVTKTSHNVRNSNLEMYRIIVMLLIVFHHFVVNRYGLWAKMQQDPLSFNSLFYYIFGMWGKTGINCFVMITGYFMCESQITIKKFLKLYIEIVFYCLICFFFLMWYYRSNINFVDLIWNFCPVKGVSSNFMGCFIVFYLLIPFLNIVYKYISKREHISLLAILTFVYVLMPLQTRYNTSMNYVSWFVFIYFIASYIRKYGVCRENNSIFWGMITICSISLAIISVVVVVCITNGAHAYYFVGEVNRPLALLVGVVSFIFFKSLSIKKNNVINVVGSCTFGVFLIHTRLGTFLWRDIFKIDNLYDSIICSVLVVLFVYVVCTMIDVIRFFFMEIPLFKRIDKIIKK